jgi:hypothetical protein
MKSTLLQKAACVALLSLCSLGLQAQTPCSTATSLSCGGSYSGTTVGGTPAGGPTFTSPQRWYAFAGNNQVVRATTTASGFDSRITVYRPSGGNTTCNSFNHIGTNDNGRNTGSTNYDAEIAWYAQTGITYYVIVYGTGTQSGSYTLDFVCEGSNAPSNDNCSGAKSFNACVTDYNLTTQNATNETINGITYNKGAWFKLSGASGSQVLTTCDGTWFDNVVNIWEVTAGAGCPTTTNPLHNNDDYCLTQSLVSFTANSSKDYYILLSGYGSTSKGGYDIHLCGTPKMAYEEGMEDVLDGAKIVASPNPANTQVSFDFAVKKDGAVTIALFNLGGQQVATLKSDALQSGMSASLDLNVAELPAGMYVYRAQIDGQLHSGKVQIAH